MTADSAPSFEVALKQLEAIVDGLERGTPELSTALAKYEEGVRLLARCHAALDQAEQSVALLTGVDAAGNPVVTPFEEGVSTESESPPAVKPAPKSRKRSPAKGNDDEAFIPF